MSYISWWYTDELIYLWQSVNIITAKIYYAFSIPILFRTLFSPWKKDTLYAENPSLSESFQIMIGNGVSRIVGAVVRLMTIFAGIISTGLTFVTGLIFLAVWILLPLIIIYLFISGAGKING